MPFQVQGSASGVAADVAGSTYKALNVNIKPVDYGSLGSYSFGAQSGIIAAALGANSEIFQFRWSDATRFAIINKITFAASVTTTFFAAGVPVQIDLIKSTAWTVQGTGGTGLTPGGNLKKRSSMGSTLTASGDLRIATTAALGTGTKTLEGSPMGFWATGGPITASLAPTIFAPFDMIRTLHGDVPIILAPSEGLSIRSVAVPGTGTWTISVVIDWTEVVGF